MARWFLALLICSVLIGCIWTATIWNNFAYRNGLIADDYLLPVSTLALLIIVLAINPLLKRFAPSISFSRRWLIVICGVLFMAALPPSAGILRQLAFPLGETVRRANTEQTMADAYEALDPPAILYPDSLAYDVELPVIEPFIHELDPGQSIPWEHWIGPITGWSGFVIPWFVMMIALAVIMSKYWQDEEKVPYPLLTIFRSIVDVPDGRRRLIPPIFTNRTFWVGCLTVFLLHALVQGKQYFPADIPAIPLRWQLSSYFTEPPWNYLGWWVKNGRIFFTFMAVAFFLPNRTSFSIWSIQIVTALYIMIGRAYFPPFQGYTINDTRTGVAIVFSLLIIWTARRHLWRVLRCTFGRAADARERAFRIAGWSFIIGCVGMVAWFAWVKVPVFYGICFVIAAILVTLTLMRVVAETGLPLFFLSTPNFSIFLKMLPLSLRTLPTMYFGGLLSVWLGSGQRVCVGAVAAQAMAMNKDDDVPRHLRLGGLFVLISVVSLIGGWLLILMMTYDFSETPFHGPVAPWGRNQFGTAEGLLINTFSGVSATPAGDHLPYIFTGILIALLLFQLCHRFPAWPLHPIGLLGTGTWCVAMIWPNIFLGWLIRNLLIQVGGTRTYLAAKPFFIGALMGELFALFVWTAIAGVLAINGMEYQSVTILPY